MLFQVNPSVLPRTPLPFVATVTVVRTTCSWLWCLHIGYGSCHSCVLRYGTCTYAWWSCTHSAVRLSHTFWLWCWWGLGGGSLWHSHVLPPGCSLGHSVHMSLVAVSCHGGLHTQLQWSVPPSRIIGTVLGACMWHQGRKLMISCLQDGHAFSH